MKLNTTGYGGQRLVKRIQVHTDDPANPVSIFTIIGLIEKFVTIDPQYVRLTGNAGAPLFAQVNIIPEASHPFKIISTRVKKGVHIRFTLDDPPAASNSGYLLTVENTMDRKGRYFDTIYLKTTSALHPELKIPVYGNIMEGEKIDSKD